jgi:dihydroneopterin aldolase
MDRITLTGMHFYGHHGCLPEETKTGQPFDVDAVLYVDVHHAGKSDDLAGTIDYSKVYDVIKDIVENHTYKLIEAVAEMIAHTILSQFAVDAVDITVHKPQAPVGGLFDDVSVTVERSRYDNLLPQPGC